MHAAIYIRVSTDDQARYGYSLAEQREACGRRATSLGASSITEYADEGISGSLLDRPGLNSLREAVKNGQIDIIIVRDPDRLSRKLAHQLLITEEFEKAGVRLEFLDFDWKDTPEGRLFYSIRGAIAEYEREKIRDRMVRGKNQKARQGGIPIGFYAYGYVYDQETGEIHVDEDEAVVVKNIYTWFISEDIGMNGIAKRLNVAGTPTRKGKGVWHRNVIRQILVNPVYKGQWRYKEYTIQVPALVEAEVWEKAQRKLKEARRLWAGSSRNEYLLSGIISCSDCGNTMTGVFAKWWGKKERRYTCRKSSQGAKNVGCVPSKAIPASVLEEAVWEQVCAWLDDPDTLAREAAGEGPREEELRRELERVEKHMADVEKGREAVLNALASGLFELDGKTRGKLADLKKRKERLEDRKKELETVLQGARRHFSGLEELRTLARGVLSRLDMLEFKEKKALVRALVSQVAVSGRGRPGGQGLRDVGVTILARLPEQEVGTFFTNVIR
ncbi:MAG: recombinase family protein [Bacillota bacterium]